MHILTQEEAREPKPYIVREELMHMKDNIQMLPLAAGIM